MPRRPPRRSLEAHKSTRTQRGATAVEFAVILPVLLMLLFGLTTAGISITHAIGLSNAVREGSRFGAIAHPDDAAAQLHGAQWTTWATDTISRVRGTQFDDPGKLHRRMRRHVQGGRPALSRRACCATRERICPAGARRCSTLPRSLRTTVATGTCVVRVWSARPFEINLVVSPVQAGLFGVVRSRASSFASRRSARDRRASRRDERGLAAIMISMMMVALMIIAGMVLDFGMVRDGRQINKSLADTAVAAGMRSFDAGDGQVYTFRGVCDTLGYLKANAPDLASLPAYPPCSSVPTLAKTCRSTDTRRSRRTHSRRRTGVTGHDQSPVHVAGGGLS